MKPVETFQGTVELKMSIYAATKRKKNWIILSNESSDL